MKAPENISRPRGRPQICENRVTDPARAPDYVNGAAAFFRSDLANGERRDDAASAT